MPSSSQAIPTPATHNVPLSAHNVPAEKVANVLPNLHNFTNELVADGHWDLDSPLCPFIPFVNVDVSSADSCVANTNQYIVNSYRRFGNVFQPKDLSRLCS